MIKISYLKNNGRDSFEYEVTIDKPKTVEEFINEWLFTRPDEWGCFGIGRHSRVFGDPECEYKHGKIIGEPLPKEFLNKKIIKVYGRGGWTNSNFVFEVE